jgi:copper chaperone CopZ
MTKITLEVGDLFSVLGAHGIERQLQRVAGVGHVSVNPVSGSTTVVYDPGKTGLSAIQEAIEDCAFIVRAQPIIRKASAHGLGHLIAPYGSEEAPPNIPPPAVPLSEIGVDRWQYDLWFQIIRAVLDGHPEQVDLTYHPALQLPAMSRYAVTTPALERWFKKHNAIRSYADRVKPFNFMCGFQASPLAATGEETFVTDDGSKSPRKTKQPPLRPIAPYSPTSKEASTHVFDRETGKPIPSDQLKIYAQALAQYHLRPEAKFENGDYCDRGPTRRAMFRRHKSTISARKPITGMSNSSSVWTKMPR